MLKNFSLRCILFFLFLSVCMHPIFAHEGHSHEAVITIGKKTIVYLQSIISTYQEVYHHLVKKDLNGIADLAKKLSEVAQQALQTEPKGPGNHMMQHVLEGAENLLKAKNIQEAQKAFASISDAILPFFKSWPNQLKRNELKMCQCKNDGHCWLQPQNLSPVCPYTSSGTFVCSEIEEVK